MKKYILPLVFGYVSVAALAGIVVVPLYFHPTTSAPHEAFPVAYYAEPLLWAGFTIAGIQSLNEASQHAVYNAAGQAFTNVIIFIVFTAISGGAIAWAFARGEKSNA